MDVHFICKGWDLLQFFIFSLYTSMKFLDLMCANNKIVIFLFTSPFCYNIYIYIYIYIYVYVRTGFDLDSEQKRTQAQKAQTINLQRAGEKCQSESRIKILVYSVKRKELYSYIYRKYPRTCPSTRTESIIFFLFAVVFLQPLCSFFFFFFFLQSFSVSPPFSLSSYYILWFFFFTPFPPSTCESGVGSHFSLLPLPLLEPSILSFKAACSLFRHHLHINAARELAGQHLMRGQQYPHIFVFSNSYPLSDIFSSPLLQGLSETLP